jgi:hypothetical protein
MIAPTAPIVADSIRQPELLDKSTPVPTKILAIPKFDSPPKGIGDVMRKDEG